MQLCRDRRLALSPRARERLRIAAAMLRGLGKRVDDAAGFIEGVLAALAALQPCERERVRDLVDWVEAYSAAEAAALGDTPDLRPAPLAARHLAKVRPDTANPLARSSAATMSIE